MGLKLAFYKTGRNEVHKVVNEGDFKEFSEQDPVMMMVENFFGIEGDNESYDTANTLLESVGLIAREDFWMEQTLMNASSHAQWHSSYLHYDRLSHTQAIKEKGFFIITTQEHAEEVDANAVINDATDYSKLMKALIKGNTTQ